MLAIAKYLGWLLRENRRLKFIEHSHNPHRRHASLGYLSPVNYERRLETAGIEANLLRERWALPRTRQGLPPGPRTESE